jgi:acyl-coenzyme A thioesterase PaaI-like protein
MSEVPAGFEPSRRTSPFLDMIGLGSTPADRERGILLGLRARTEHCNTRGFVHGAILAALLDVVCAGATVAPHRAPQPGRGLTVDFVAAARMATGSGECEPGHPGRPQAGTSPTAGSTPVVSRWPAQHRVRGRVTPRSRAG